MADKNATPTTASGARGQPRVAFLLAGLGKATVWTGLAIGAAWAVLALWFYGSWPPWVRVPAALLLALLAVAAVALLPRRAALTALALGIVAVWGLWRLRTPSNDRDWTPDQARMPLTTFDGDAVAIENVRSAVYRTIDDYDVAWHTRRYDLRDLRTVDFLVERFASWRGPAHTLLTFGFADGRHLAVSAEIRKQRGESFSPLAGLFRQYEMMYVIGDERDLIGLRVNLRRHPVTLFPIAARPENVRALFVAVLERANGLRQRPEFYNTVTNSCSTNIVRHLEQVSRRKVPFDLRILFPGYSDALAHAMGLIDFDGTLEEARARFSIDGPLPHVDDPDEWSRRLRETRQRDRAAR